MLTEAIQLLDEMMDDWKQEEAVIKPYLFLEIAYLCGSLEAYPVSERNTNDRNTLVFVLAGSEHRTYPGVGYKFTSALSGLWRQVNELRAGQNLERVNLYDFDAAVDYETANQDHAQFHIILFNRSRRVRTDKPYYFFIECTTLRTA